MEGVVTKQTGGTYAPVGIAPSYFAVNVCHADSCKKFSNSCLEYLVKCFVLVSLQGCNVRGGADKSLARPTSRCRRTESIVSLERGSVHVPNCKSLLVTEAERKHVRRRARVQQHGDASCHQVFSLARQGAEGNSRYSERNIRGTCTIVCHRQKLGGTV